MINIPTKRIDPLILTIDTTLAGSPSNEFILPWAFGGVRSDNKLLQIKVDWGDGLFELLSSQNGTSGNSFSHTYSVAGVYDVSIYQVGTSGRPFFNNTGDRLKVTGIRNWGRFAFPDAATVTFFGCTNLTYIPPERNNRLFARTTTVNSCFRSTRITALPSFYYHPDLNFTNYCNGISTLTTVPADIFQGVTSTVLNGAFTGCALNQQSVDNILVSLNSNGTSGGTIAINGGTNSTPSSTGRAAADALRARGWIVSLNEY